MAKTKKGFLDGYKTYTSGGSGSVREWGRAFDERMGVGEANRVLREDDPLVIMGFTSLPFIDDLKRAYRKLMMIHHPDRGGDHETAKKIIAAYSILEDRISRA